MGDIVEREEGLFSRHGATRALCVYAIGSWAIVVGALIFLIYAGLSRNQAIGQEFPFRTFGLIAASGAGALGILWLWRRCDRCRRRLFSDASSHSAFFPNQKLEHRAWQFGSSLGEPERHYRAKALWGSYRNKALLQMALTGRLRCQWCDHEDGAKPDYVVTPDL